MTRLYFGTDTHAQSILVGAAGLFDDHHPERRATREWPRGDLPRGRTILTVLGVAGFAGTLLLTFTQQGSPASTTTGDSPCRPSRPQPSSSRRCVSPVGRCPGPFAARPGVARDDLLGAYLWHYPVFVYFDSGGPGQTDLALLAVRFASPSGWPPPATTWWSGR